MSALRNETIDRLSTMICTKACFSGEAIKSHSVACYLLVVIENQTVNRVPLVRSAYPRNTLEIIAPINKCAARYRKVPRDQIEVAGTDRGINREEGNAKRGERREAVPIYSPRTFVTVRDYARALHRTLHSIESAAREGKRRRRRTYAGSSPVLHGRLHLFFSLSLSLSGSAARHGDTRIPTCTPDGTIF